MTLPCFRVSVTPTDYGESVAVEGSCDYFITTARMSYLLPLKYTRGLYAAKLLRVKRLLARSIRLAREEVEG